MDDFLRCCERYGETIGDGAICTKDHLNCGEWRSYRGQRLCNSCVVYVADALIAALEAACSQLKFDNKTLEWQSMPNRNPAGRGAFEFYINELWEVIGRIAIDSDTGCTAILAKRRRDPDDDRVRIRLIKDDDGLLNDLDDQAKRIAALEAEVVAEKSHNSNVWCALQDLRMRSDDLAEQLAEAERDDRLTELVWCDALPDGEIRAFAGPIGFGWCPDKASLRIFITSGDGKYSYGFWHHYATENSFKKDANEFARALGAAGGKGGRVMATEKFKVTLENEAAWRAARDVLTACEEAERLAWDKAWKMTRKKREAMEAMCDVEGTIRRRSIRRRRQQRKRV